MLGRPLTAETRVRIPVAVLQAARKYGTFAVSRASWDSSWDSPARRCEHAAINDRATVKARAELNDDMSTGELTILADAEQRGADVLAARAPLTV